MQLTLKHLFFFAFCITGLSCSSERTFVVENDRQPEQKSSSAPCKLLSLVSFAIMFVSVETEISDCCVSIRALMV